MTLTLVSYQHFGVDQGGEIQFKVKKRGAQPSGGGEVGTSLDSKLTVGYLHSCSCQVYFSCPIVRELKPINVVDEGLVKRIR